VRFTVLSLLLLAEPSSPKLRFLRVVRVLGNTGATVVEAVARRPGRSSAARRSLPRRARRLLVGAAAASSRSAVFAVVVSHCARR
jgi:hypothetical protein